MSEEILVKFLTLFKQHKTLVVDFTKVNGDFRSMTCTLDESLLPIKEAKEKKERKLPHDSLAVYDRNACGWRSFKVASVISISVVDEAGNFQKLYTKE